MLLLIIFISIMATILWYYGAIREKRKKIEFRTCISEQEFYSLFLQIKKKSLLDEKEVIKILKYIAKSLHLSWEKLRPSDSMKFLGPADGWEYDDEINDFFQYFKNILTNESSLADLIELFEDDKFMFDKIKK